MSLEVSGSALKHGCRDFGTAWPLTASLAGTGLIPGQLATIGLYHLAVLQE